MAKVLLKGFTQFTNNACPHVPYYKVTLELIGKATSLVGQAIVGHEDGQWSLRWFEPVLIDDLDINWNGSIADAVIEYAELKIWIDAKL